MSHIFFSIIIPTYKRNDLLYKCLNSILSFKKNKNFKFEIIVTSDSFDDTLLLKKLFISREIVFVNGPRKGPAANRNNGAKQAKGDWLIFLDDDIVPDSQLLLSYSTAISKYPNVHAFEGAIHPDDWKLLELDMAECPVNTNGGCFWSANVCIKRNVFEQILGFDEQFEIAAQEDQDIYNRLKEVTKVCFLPNALVIHPVRIIKFGKKICSLRPALLNWFRYSTKYNTLIKSVVIGYHSQLAALYQNIKKSKFKSALCNFYVIIILLPIICINFKRIYYSKKN